MTIARRWVFPIIWMVIVAVAAAALVKIAFFPDVQAGADPAQPGAVITEPEWVVETGTVRNDVSLTGTIAADPAVPIPATLAGQVWEVMVGAGQWVDAGAEIAEIRAEAVRSDGTPYTRYKTVTAPISGVLSSFPTLEGTITSVGGPLGQIAPPSFHVTGPIPATELYRLIQKPTEATVTINGGPAPFACTGLQNLTPVAGQDAGGTGGALRRPFYIPLIPKNEKSPKSTPPSRRSERRPITTPAATIRPSFSTRPRPITKQSSAVGSKRAESPSTSAFTVAPSAAVGTPGRG